MQLSVAYQGGKRYDILSDGHRVVTDQAVEDGGSGVGMTPVELFVGSVAACIGYFVGRFCERHDIARDGLRVDAEWTMAEGPHRVGSIAVKIRLSSPPTGEPRERLLRVAHGCTVHQSLAGALPMTIDLVEQSVEKKPAQ